MFDSLLAWFGGARNWLDWLWRECWRQIAKVFTSLWGWGLIAVGWVYTVAKWIGDVMREMAATIDQLKFPDIAHGSGPMTNAMAFANTILPLQELLAFTVAYIALRLALSVYKIVKSWIPTLS